MCGDSYSVRNDMEYGIHRSGIPQKNLDDSREKDNPEIKYHTYSVLHTRKHSVSFDFNELIAL